IVGFDLKLRVRVCVCGVCGVCVSVCVRLFQKLDNLNLDLSDDEELREQMDLHSIIVSCVNEEPLFTAEQVKTCLSVMAVFVDLCINSGKTCDSGRWDTREVEGAAGAGILEVIEEIEEMMQESPDPEAEESPSQSDLSMLSHELHSLSHSTSTSSYEERQYLLRLRGLGVCELEELLEGVEREIRRYSEELIEQLALRDELDFEKEVKNGFISILIDVQNRQKEHREMMKRRRKVKSAAGTQRNERTHLPGTVRTAHTDPVHYTVTQSEGLTSRGAGRGDSESVKVDLQSAEYRSHHLTPSLSPPSLLLFLLLHSFSCDAFIHRISRSIQTPALPPVHLN
ncbi:hypothetical protein NFI96_029857, partial [Prochilodus magdalenae]